MSGDRSSIPWVAAQADREPGAEGDRLAALSGLMESELWRPGMDLDQGSFALVRWAVAEIARLRAGLEAIRDTRPTDIHIEHGADDPVAWMQERAHAALEPDDR